MIHSLPEFLRGTEVIAVVASITTSDGMMGINANIGDRYEVYPSHTAKVKAYNTTHNQYHEKLMIWARNEKDEGFLCADCLEWAGKEKHLKQLNQVH